MTAPRRRKRLNVEALEDRRLPATFAPFPAVADGDPGSLRAAILAANQNGQNDVISLAAGTYRLTRGNTAGQANAAATGERLKISYQGFGSDVNDVVLKRIDIASMFPDRAITSPLGEGGVAYLTGRISDPDPLDTFLLDVDWGDGSR